MDYPKWKYSQSGDVIVNSAEDESELSGQWFDSPADVPAVVVALSDDEQMLVDAKAEKEQLTAEATARGIAIDKRWGLAKIKEALAAPVVVDVHVAAESVI